MTYMVAALDFFFLTMSDELLVAETRAVDSSSSLAYDVASYENKQKR